MSPLLTHMSAKSSEPGLNAMFTDSPFLMLAVTPTHSPDISLLSLLSSRGIMTLLLDFLSSSFPFFS